jgi:hypothetical protein
VKNVFSGLKTQFANVFIVTAVGASYISTNHRIYGKDKGHPKTGHRDPERE